MAYSSTAGPQLVAGRAGGGIGVWAYSNSDSLASMAATGYIANGAALGLRVGDIFLATNVSTAGAYVGHSNGRVSAVTASSAATITFVSSST